MEKHIETPGDRVKKSLQILNLTQTAFGDSLEITQETVSKYISGKLVISLLTALAIEAVHKISHKWLLFGKGQMFITANNQKSQMDILKKEFDFIKDINRAKGLRQTIEDLLLLPANDQEMIRNMVKNLKSKL